MTTAPTTTGITSGETRLRRCRQPDVLYWYCNGVVSSRAHFEDRKDRFLFEYQVLSHYDPDWGKRMVRELAAKFRKWRMPEDIALRPDIGEPL